jgi:hypothetical protein
VVKFARNASTPSINKSESMKYLFGCAALACAQLRQKGLLCLYNRPFFAKLIVVRVVFCAIFLSKQESPKSYRHYIELLRNPLEKCQPLMLTQQEISSCTKYCNF